MEQAGMDLGRKPIINLHMIINVHMGPRYKESILTCGLVMIMLYANSHRASPKEKRMVSLENWLHLFSIFKKHLIASRNQGFKSCRTPHLCRCKGLWMLAIGLR